MDQLPKFGSHHIRPSEEAFSLRVLLASTSLLALPTYKALQGTNHQLVGLLLKEELPSGRGLERQKNELAQYMAEHGVDVFRVKNHEDLFMTLSKLSVDVVIAISFGLLVKPESLQLPKYGWINLHFSLLPKYRGAAPVQRAILAGEDETGVSVFQLEEGMDTGPVFRQKRVPISGKSSGELLDTLANLGADEVVHSLDMLAEGRPPVAQNGIASLAPKITNLETRIDFNQSVEIVLRKIAAFSPIPGAWCEFQGKRMKILVAAPATDISGEPGACLSTGPLVIACKSGAMQVLEVQEAGKRRMSAADWVRGARIELGAMFS